MTGSKVLVAAAGQAVNHCLWLHLRHDKTLTSHQAVSSPALTPAPSLAPAPSIHPDPTNFIVTSRPPTLFPCLDPLPPAFALSPTPLLLPTPTPLEAHGSSASSISESLAHSVRGAKTVNTNQSNVSKFSNQLPGLFNPTSDPAPRQPPVTELVSRTAFSSCITHCSIFTKPHMLMSNTTNCTTSQILLLDGRKLLLLLY